MRELRKPRALALVLVMLALGVLAAATLAVTAVSSYGTMQTKSQDETDEALFTAQAGLNLKLAELRAGDSDDIDGSMTHSAATYQVEVFASGETVKPGFTVPGSETFYLLSEGKSVNGRSRRLGMLVGRTSSTFTAAILAGTTVTLQDGSFTDTFDSSNPLAAVDHSLANIGLWDTGATINIDSTSRVGLDVGSASADVVVPTGGSGSQILSGTAGSEYNSLRVDALLTAPPTIAPRDTSGPKVNRSDGSIATISPTLIGGEWIFRSDELKVENFSTIKLDISMVPDGEVAHFDVGKVIMETGGRIEIDDGGQTDAAVELYAENEFIVLGGVLINPSERPDRFKLFCRVNDIKIGVLSAAYIVAQSGTKVDVTNGSAIYGSVVAPEVKLQAGSAVHYDQTLATTGTGGSGLQLLHFHRL